MIYRYDLWWWCALNCWGQQWRFRTVVVCGSRRADLSRWRLRQTQQTELAFWNRYAEFTQEIFQTSYFFAFVQSKRSSWWRLMLSVNKAVVEPWRGYLVEPYVFIVIYSFLDLLFHISLDHHLLASWNIYKKRKPKPTGSGMFSKRVNACNISPGRSTISEVIKIEVTVNL